MHETKFHSILQKKQLTFDIVAYQWKPLPNKRNNWINSQPECICWSNVYWASFRSASFAHLFPNILFLLLLPISAFPFILLQKEILQLLPYCCCFYFSFCSKQSVQHLPEKEKIWHNYLIKLQQFSIRRLKFVYKSFKRRKTNKSYSLI